MSSSTSSTTSVRNFYSVSISGYHIAEAGANPITQLAFTLANGFTYVEYYLSRGMDIDSLRAQPQSFFFSNGIDPEYAVIGRVARRIWAKAMREKYGADERAQKLKYHIQTSRAVPCTPRRSTSTTSAPRCRRCTPSTTTATRCTPTPTTRPSPQMLKHTGEYPIVGVNTFLSKEGSPPLFPARSFAPHKKKSNNSSRTSVPFTPCLLTRQPTRFARFKTPRCRAETCLMFSWRRASGVLWDN